jgi:predicted  nucleic acid-binding Zn-ribbon protein
MTDVDKVVYLLDMFSSRQKEGQLAVLLHNAARMLEDKMDIEEIVNRMVLEQARLADQVIDMALRIEKIEEMVSQVERRLHYVEAMQSKF